MSVVRSALASRAASRAAARPGPRQQAELAPIARRRAAPGARPCPVAAEALVEGHAGEVRRPARASGRLRSSAEEERRVAQPRHDHPLHAPHDLGRGRAVAVVTAAKRATGARSSRSEIVLLVVDEHGLEHLGAAASGTRPGPRRPRRSGTRRGRATPRAGRGRRRPRPRGGRGPRRCEPSRSAGSRITNRSRSARSRSANDPTSTGRPPEPCGRKRWPRVAPPLSTTTGPCAPSSQGVDRERHDRAVEQQRPASGSAGRTGRRPCRRRATRPSSSASGRRARAERRRGAPGSTSAVGRPATLPHEEQVPLARLRGVLRRPRPGPRRRPPFFFAKPWAAPVHFPAASFATLSDGPQTGSSRSAWRAGDVGPQHEAPRRPQDGRVLRRDELAGPRPRGSARAAARRGPAARRRHLLEADLERGAQPRAALRRRPAAGATASDVGLRPPRRRACGSSGSCPRAGSPRWRRARRAR